MVFLVGGLLFALLSQIYIVARAFKFNFSAGLILTPVYIFVNSDLRKESKLRDVLKVWVSSIMLLIVGAVVLSFYNAPLQ